MGRAEKTPSNLPRAGKKTKQTEIGRDCAAAAQHRIELRIGVHATVKETALLKAGNRIHGHQHNVQGSPK